MSDNKPLEPDEPLFEGPADDLELENEILLMKLKAEFGGEHHFFGDGPPPEIQHAFLKSVYAFEQMHAEEFQGISVYRKIAEPYFIEEHALSETGIEIELKRLTNILFENNIVLDVAYKYEPRVIYSFIINQLFNHEIEQVEMPGYYRHFSYEDFHPNDKEDLKKYSTEFVEEIIHQEMCEGFNHLYEFLISSTGEIQSRAVAYQKIVDFYNDFSSLILKNFEIHSVEIKEDNAIVQFFIQYEGMMADKETVVINGEGKFEFVKDFVDFWFIQKINMPGLII